MKKQYFFLAAFALCLAAPTFAQRYVAVERKVPMDKGEANAWVMQVDEPLDDLMKSFDKYAKSQWDVKMKKAGKDMLVAKESTIAAISDKQGDLKAKFYTADGQNTLAVAFMPGYDVSLNTYDNEEGMDNLKKFVKNFVKTFKSDQIQATIVQDEKRLKDLQSDLKKDERDYQSLNKKISGNESDIEKGKDKDKAFDLKNENIENRARLAALDEIMTNVKEEINKVRNLISDHRTALGSLEEQFAEEPYARQTQDEDQQK